MFHTSRNSRGMTLMEVMISFALALILVMGVLQFGGHMLKRSRFFVEQAENQGNRIAERTGQSCYYDPSRCAALPQGMKVAKGIFSATTKNTTAVRGVASNSDWGRRQVVTVTFRPTNAICTPLTTMPESEKEVCDCLNSRVILQDKNVIFHVHGGERCNFYYVIFGS